MNLIRNKKRRVMKDFLFENSKTMAIFFCAAFHGLNDASYALLHNLHEVVLVDVDEQKVNEMKIIYPTNWTFIVGDALEIASKFSKQGRRFDIVTCDPWTPYATKIMNEYFFDFWNLSNKYFILCSTTVKYFYDVYNISPSKASLEKYLLKLFGRKIIVNYVAKASDFEGGCYYIVFEGGCNS